MSVLIEALTLVVRRQPLDIGYPGGTDAFMKAMCEPDVACRLTCADDQLVAASFCSGDDATPIIERLRECGLVDVDDERFIDFAVVDQALGPCMPCEWLEWRKHPEGYTYGWVAGTDPDPLHVPENWTPEQSRALTRTDARDEQPDRYMKLAEEDGFETWLDLQTGHLNKSLVQPRESVPATGDTAVDSTAPDTPRPAFSDADLEAVIQELEAEGGDMGDGPLARLFKGVFAERGVEYQEKKAGVFRFTTQRDHSSYAVTCICDEEDDVATVWLSFPPRAPAARHPAVAELLHRLNLRLRLGNFELDFDDGEMRYRVGFDCEGGVPSQTMVDNMIGIGLVVCEQYHDAIMSVAFGGVAPVSALPGEEA